MSSLILFGARSPLVVEYEESCHRAGIAIAALINVEGAPRAIAMDLVVDLANVTPQHTAVPCVTCAFSSQRRRELVALATKSGFKIANALIDPTAIIASSTTVGRGSYINAGCVIGAVSRIGENTVINRGGSIGHHVVIGDFVTFGPSVTLAGNIRIGDDCLIGAGSTILPNLRIGAGAIVAAGSVVRRNVEDGKFVAGNPAIEKPFDFAKSSLNVPGGE